MMNPRSRDSPARLGRAFFFQALSSRGSVRQAYVARRALGRVSADLQDRYPPSASVSKFLQVLDPQHHLDLEHKTRGQLVSDVVGDLPSLTVQCHVWDDLRGQERERALGNI